jgi:hypothetical protein
VKPGALPCATAEATEPVIHFLNQAARGSRFESPVKPESVWSRHAVLSGGVPFSERVRHIAKELLMNSVLGEAWIVRHAAYYSDPEAGPDALLNDATEWLQYAYCSIQVLAELVRERGNVDARQVPVVLEGVGVFIDMGMRCAAQAHLRMQWEEVQEEGSSVVP